MVGPVSASVSRMGEKEQFLLSLVCRMPLGRSRQSDETTIGGAVVIAGKPRSKIIDSSDSVVDDDLGQCDEKDRLNVCSTTTNANAKRICQETPFFLLLGGEDSKTSHWTTPQDGWHSSLFPIALLFPPPPLLLCSSYARPAPLGSLRTNERAGHAHFTFRSSFRSMTQKGWEEINKHNRQGKKGVWRM